MSGLPDVTVGSWGSIPSQDTGIMQDIGNKGFIGFDCTFGEVCISEVCIGEMFKSFICIGTGFGSSEKDFSWQESCCFDS